MTDAVTLDRFLNGRITVAQPKSGFRAGHDSVLLAAAVPADPSSRVLELGSGVGVASLCLAARVPGVVIVGIDIDPDLVSLASANAARNGFATVYFAPGDANGLVYKSAPYERGPPREQPMSPESVDHVFFNPPFHPDSAHVSPVTARDRAMRDSSGAARAWTMSALKAARDGGTITAIIRADRIDEILDAARGYGGIVFPLRPRADAAPKRAIVRIKKVKGDISCAAGLILHEADGRNTEAAEAVLRHGQALNLAP